VFNLPRWTIPAIAFNNTTSLPLLLIQSLETTGILTPLVSKGEEISEAVSRARTYFLVSAVVSHALTFGIGGSELKGDDEDPPEDNKKRNGNGNDTQVDGAPRQRYRDDPEAQDDDDEDDESSDSAPETSLLPHAVHHRVHRANKHTHKTVNGLMEKLPAWLQTAIMAVYNFMTPPLVGALIGLIIGLTPPLHTLFFANSSDGGYFNAWLTQSIKNVGQLFVTLQVVVVGVKLAQALRKEKRGEDTGKLNWIPVTTVAVVRYIIWPT
jgi:predicted permease